METNVLNLSDKELSLHVIDDKFDPRIFKEVNDNLPIGIFVLDAKHRCLYANKALFDLTGFSPKAYSGDWLSVIHPADRSKVRVASENLKVKGQSIEIKCRVFRGDASTIWIKICYSMISNQPRFLGYMSEISNIDEPDKHEQNYKGKNWHDRREMAETTLDSIGDAVVSTDTYGMVTFLNLAAEQMTGWLKNQAVGRPLNEIFHIVETSTGNPIVNPALKAMHENKKVNFYMACSLIRKDGYILQVEDTATPIHNRLGEITGAVIVFHDVSELQTTANKMERLARYDTLTDLPNRRLLEERCMEAILSAQSERKSFALIFIDIDNFKEINDSLGHMIGDYCLQSTANRLSKCIRLNDTVCRHGGDEFVILLSNLKHKKDALSVVNKINAAFLSSHNIQGNLLNLSISMGISIYPYDGEDIHTLMLTADKAMYSAKKHGKNGFVFSS